VPEGVCVSEGVPVAVAAALEVADVDAVRQHRRLDARDALAEQVALDLADHQRTVEGARHAVLEGEQQAGFAAVEPAAERAGAPPRVVGTGR
jgi:hypothetical protein